MAVRAVTKVVREDKAVVITWTGILENDTGLPVRIPRYPDKTVQVFGTFGAGGTITMEGSADNTNWGTLHDPQGANIGVQDLDPVLIEDNTNFIRPRNSAGDGNTTLTVVIIAHAKGT